MFARIKAFFARLFGRKAKSAPQAFKIRSKKTRGSSLKDGNIMKPLPNACPICGTESTINRVNFVRCANGKYECKTCGHIAS